jgi:co-chaperonin GroES (HSP10)
MKALLSKIIVKIAEEKTILESTTAKQSRKGIVVSIGRTSSLSEDIKEGDTVLFGAFAGIAFEEGGEKYAVLNESEVLTPIP